MAKSYVQYNASGRNYSVPFPYLSQGHIQVTIGDAVVAFSWLSPGLIQLAAEPPQGTVVVIRRVTPSVLPLVDYTDGSILAANDLDTTALQTLYISQETEDTVTTVATVLQGNIDQNAVIIQSNLNQAAENLSTKIDDTASSLSNQIVNGDANLQSQVSSLSTAVAATEKASATGYSLKGNLTSVPSPTVDIPFTNFATPGNPAGDALKAYSRSGTLAYDSRVFNDDAKTSGPYSDFSCKSDNTARIVNTEAITPSANGALRDHTMLHISDRDTKDYGALAYRVITNGLRVFVTGLYSAGKYVKQFKDLHGAYFFAAGNNDGQRGVSGIVADAVQFGNGVATNEFSAGQYAGTDEQAKLLTGVLGITYSYRTDQDATHNVYGVASNLFGYRATAAFRAASVPAVGQPGAAKVGLMMEELTVTNAAITMPGSLAGTGSSGTTIYYADGDYTSFDRSNNVFYHSIGNQNIHRVTPVGAGPASPNWNGPHLLLGDCHIWVDDNFKLRMKAGAPTSSTDGVVIGSQA